MMKMKKNIGTLGFTLIEMLLAVSLLAIGLLAAASMQAIAINSNSLANRISVANMLAQEVAEDLLSRSITDPTLTNKSVPGAHYIVDVPHNSNTISIPGAGTYTTTYDITPDTPIAGTTQIVVSVKYNATNKIAQYTTFKMVQ
jgi:type IV pilus assembly protein PilV